MKIVNTALTRALAAILIGSLMIAYAMMPEVFMNYLVYIIAILIVFAAIGEFVALGVTLNVIKNYKEQLKDVEFEEGTEPVVPKIGYFYWIPPTLLLLFGLIILIRPAIVASTPFLYFGYALLAYALSEIINGIKFYAVRRTIQKELDSFVDVEEGINENEDEKENENENGNRSVSVSDGDGNSDNDNDGSLK